MPLTLTLTLTHLHTHNGVAILRMAFPTTTWRPPS
jgi:hypothetical protein